MHLFNSKPEAFLWKHMCKFLVETFFIHLNKKNIAQ